MSDSGIEWTAIGDKTWGERHWVADVGNGQRASIRLDCGEFWLEAEHLVWGRVFPDFQEGRRYYTLGDAKRKMEAYIMKVRNSMAPMNEGISEFTLVSHGDLYNMSAKPTEVLDTIVPGEQLSYLEQLGANFKEKAVDLVVEMFIEDLDFLCKLLDGSGWNIGKIVLWKHYETIGADLTVGYNARVFRITSNRANAWLVCGSFLKPTILMWLGCKHFNHRVSKDQGAAFSAAYFDLCQIMLDFENSK